MKTKCKSGLTEGEISMYCYLKVLLVHLNKELADKKINLLIRQLKHYGTTSYEISKNFNSKIKTCEHCKALFEIHHLLWEEHLFEKNCCPVSSINEEEIKAFAKLQSTNISKELKNKLIKDLERFGKRLWQIKMEINARLKNCEHCRKIYKENLVKD